MPFDLAAPVIRHEPLGRDHFLLTIECRPIARDARAGQFVMLQAREGYDPLLRRPMSIYRILPGRRGLVQVLYKVVGEGTRYLSRQPIGATLMTLGPLGNGFRLPRWGRGHAAADEGTGAGVPGRPVMVAGGIGIAIFPFLVETLARLHRRPLLLFGGRTGRDLVALDFFRSRGITARLATEDGSAGTKGLVTRLLEPLLAKPEGVPEVFACGPTPMLRAVGALALRSGVPCQLALESQMPCGIGVCLGCVVSCPPDDRGPTYRRVCTEGPIFPASEVLL
jgi:dihydroorotate dehydrogenase electron transfer subunit